MDNFRIQKNIKGITLINSLSMRMILSVSLFTFSSLIAYNQIITGTVSDKKTKERIVFAAIYFNGSFVGTHSDENGNFKLDITGNAYKPLTISALGYFSVTLSEIPVNKPLVIYLTPKVFELKEVVINAKAKDKNLRIFKENFLGTSQNASRCEIVNEKDISITFENDTLKAYATNPIQIINYGLGYKATYYLDRFWFYKKRNAFLISGNMVFNEDLINDIPKKEYYIISRKQAYLGSRMHFFRALWENDLESEGFSLTNLGNVELTYSSIIVQPDSTRKLIKFNGIIKISDHIRMTASWMSFIRDYVYFDKRGYYDWMGISWDGAMARQRIADWLPYEYSIK